MGSSKSSHGFSLIEMMMVTAVMGVLMYAMMSMQTSQMRSNNFLEFQLKRTQLNAGIMGQFLSDPNNCSCLFAGATDFPVAGIGSLTGFTQPTQIGRYSFATPGVCATATIPQPLIDTTGMDGIKLANVSLINVTSVAGTYSGNLILAVQSTKEVLGPRDLNINIPVVVNTVPSAPGTVSFQSCSLSGGAAVDRTLAIIKSKSDSTESPNFGGPGGYASSQSACRGSSFINGFWARTGSGVDRLNAKCLSYDGLLTSTGGIIGGSGGGPTTTIMCPAGTYASGIRGTINGGPYVHRFGLACTDPITFSTSTTAQAGGGGGAPFSWDCPAGSYVFELISTSGNTMDSIQAICAKM